MIVFKTQFGSHIFGTNLPTSDLDYKAIYLPEPKEILLGKAKETIVSTTKTDKSARNSAEDVDCETFSLKQYIKLLLEGQTVAIDVLFTPPKWWAAEHWTEHWTNIIQNKDKFIHKGYTGFMGYIHSQANKYGIKGSRIKAIRTALSYLEPAESFSKLGYFVMRNEIPKDEFINIVLINGPHGDPEHHLEVCGRKIPFHANIKYTRDILQKILDNYGQRALQAEKNEGVDWKALMHAVRIASQSVELLTTSHITFPRPDAHLLLKIRKGELPYVQVASMIEEGLLRIELASCKSDLPATPDYEFAENVVYDAYKAHIIGA